VADEPPETGGITPGFTMDMSMRVLITTAFLKLKYRGKILGQRIYR
jgi:hypothetical protein